MPSRSNPNMPSKAKRKTAGVLKSKRKNNQRLVSAKKARKLMRKKGYTQQRKELQQYLEAEIEMKDVDGKATRKPMDGEAGKEEAVMDVD
ncbi:MAG: hypothetical protein Q9213_006655 [Squamulea squamosa]